MATPETTATVTPETLEANTATRRVFDSSTSAMTESVIGTTPQPDSGLALASHTTQAGHSQLATNLIITGANDEHLEFTSVRPCHG